MNRKSIAALAVAAVMTLGVGASSYAWFTSQATSSANTVITGTLKLGAVGAITDQMAVGNIYPGWIGTSKTVTISNTGSLDLKYKINVLPLSGNILYEGTTPLQVNINNQGFKNINALGEVYLGEISSHDTGTFDIVFKMPTDANNDYMNKAATFNFNFTAAQLNDTSFTVSNVATLNAIIINNINELNAAINNQQDGQTWIIKSGNYGLTMNDTYTASGQTGWYLPLTANNLTIRGEGNPVIYGNEYSADGNWNTQNLVTAFGNNITLKGLRLMTKVEGNKTVEVVGANFKIEDCTIEPNTLCASSMYDNMSDAIEPAYGISIKDFSKQWGGSLYFSAAGNHVVKNVTIKNGGISFKYSPVGTHIDFQNVNIINDSNNNFLNSYRYSSGFNNADCSMTGKPVVTYLLDNAIGNATSVAETKQEGDIVQNK